MAELNDWSTSAASNTTLFPEGMSRAAVNNNMREAQAILRRHHADTNGSLVTAGSSTVYTVTLNSQHSAWFDGLTFRARMDETCGATPTINPTGSGALGAKSIYWNDGTQVAAGDLVANGVYDFVYKSGTDRVYVLSASAPPVAASSETVAGKVELATQAEVNTGADTARAITPAGLTGWAPAVGTVTVVSTDKVLLADASASGVLKQGLVSDITALVGFGLVPIERKTGSAVASYDFTTGITSTYRTYRLIGHLIPATDDVELWLRLDANAGASFDAGASDYKWGVQGQGSGGGSEASDSDGDTKIAIARMGTAGWAIGNGAAEGVSFAIDIHMPSTSAVKTKLSWLSCFYSANDHIQASFGGGFRDAAQADDAIQLLFESGNIASGDVTLYGVRNS